MSITNSNVPRVTGLLIIEARNSNPNGDPDRESDPRTRSHDGRGIISDVSFKRKLRELVLEKRGPVWLEMQKQMNLNASRFGIHVDQETRDKSRGAQPQGAKKSLSEEHWDVRVFGSTALEKGDNFTRTGVVQFGIGVSIAKVRIQRDTNTVKANVDASKSGDADRGMAPLGFRIIEHGVYAMPFLINPTAAFKSGCTPEDVELLCKLLPYAYSHNSSRVRPFVEIRHAWFFEHKSTLGSASDFAIIDDLTPKKSDPEIPSSTWQDYNYDGASVEKHLCDRFSGKYERFGDLCDSAFAGKVFGR